MAVSPALRRIRRQERRLIAFATDAYWRGNPLMREPVPLESFAYGHTFERMTSARKYVVSKDAWVRDDDRNPKQIRVVWDVPTTDAGHRHLEYMLSRRGKTLPLPKVKRTRKRLKPDAVTKRAQRALASTPVETWTARVGE